MKKIISIAFLMLMTVMTMAQNQKISYQMVVRNAANEIVPNTSGVEVTISLLDANNGIMYSEKHTLTTDVNGLISCFIGDGDLLSGEYNNVVWENASIETKLLVPGETEVSATQKLGFLPHALYAKNLNFQFLEDYLNAHGYLDSLSLRDSIANILNDFPYNTSAYVNDANYLTEVLEMQVLSLVGDTLYISNGNHIVLPANFNGDYNSLTNTPLIPDSTSQMFNDAGFLTPADMPDTVSRFQNDAGYLTKDSLTDLVNHLSEMLKTYDTLSNLIEQFSQLADSLNKGIRLLDSLHPCLAHPTVTDAENNVYHTLQIGEQCWLKENLRSTEYADGTPIALGDTISDSVAYRYYPLGNADNVAQYGYLYNWKAVMNSAPAVNGPASGVQGPCPTGWHVPTLDEWNTLLTYVASVEQYRCDGTAANIAKALAAGTGWKNSLADCAIGNNLNENNATHFSMLPAGCYNSDNEFEAFSERAYFWTTTQNGVGTAESFVFEYTTPHLYMQDSHNQTEAYSLRCVKDK